MATRYNNERRYASVSVELGNGLMSFITDATAEKQDSEVHNSHRHFQNLSTSYNSKEVRSQLETGRPIFLVNLDKEDRRFDQILRESKKVYLATYLKGFPNEEDFLKFIEPNIMNLSKVIWILSKKEWLEYDNQYTSFIEKMVSLRQKAMDQANIQSGSFPIQVIVSAIMNQWRWKGNLAITQTMIKEKRPDRIAKFLEIQYAQRLQKVTNILGLGKPDGHLNLKIQIQTNASMSSAGFELEREVDRIKLAYKQLYDIIDDPHNPFRQQLQQLHKIPNVRVSEFNVNNFQSQRPSDMSMLIELCPLEIEGLTSLVKQVEKGTFGVILEDAYFNYRQVPLNGHILVSLQTPFDPVRFPLEHRTQEFPSMNKLKGIIVTSFYKEMLEAPKKTPFDFLTILRSITANEPAALLEDIKDGAEYNALHLAVKAQRTDFLKMIFYMNKWGELRQKVVKMSNTHPHAGYTPRRLAEAFSFKGKGQIVLDEYDYLDGLYTRMSVLEKACLCGRLDLAKLIIEADKSLLSSNCLFNACGAGHHHIVDLLMQSGIDYRKVNSKKENCLQMAAMFGYSKVLDIMYKHKFDIMGNRNVDGFNAFDLSVMNGDLESIKLYQKCNFPMEANALVLAVQYKRTHVFQFLTVECGLSAETGKDKDERLPIHHAVAEGDINTLKKLLILDADIATVDLYDKNVVHLAAESNQHEALVLLFKTLSKDMLHNMINARDVFTGKDLFYLVRGKDRGRRAWHWVELRRLYIKLFNDALKRGQVDVAQHGKIIMSGYGANPDPDAYRKIETKKEMALKQGNRKPDMTPLHYATNHTSCKLVHILLESGADPNIGDFFGATSLHHAAMHGNLETLKALVNAGGSLDLLTNDGKSVYTIASENGHFEILNYIEGRPIILTAEKFLSGAFQHVKKQLGSSTLTRKRANGEDIKRHVIDTLRGLTIDVNVLLMEIGSGPVLEATSDG